MPNYSSREKFLATMDFNLSPPPSWEFGYWAGTVRRWYKEGLPQINGIPSGISAGTSVGKFLHRAEKSKCKDLERVVKIDKPAMLFPVKSWVFPEFKTKLIKEFKDGRRIVIDSRGVKKRVSVKDDSIPEYLDWPVKTREDWEKFKAERLNLKTQGRYPDNLNNLIEIHKDRDYPLYMGGNGGFFGSLRILLGEVRLFTFYYDEPTLIKDMINYLANFWIELYSPILLKVKPDFFLIWEDMCYKTGPLISPEIFKKFMLPAYKRFISFLKNNGVENIIVDTDGNCWKLIPLFIEGGVTGLLPMEVAAGMDVVKVRKKFPKLQIMGGIDKRVLAKDKSFIDKELESKVPFMLKHGGYIPHVDHNVPPDVPFDNFVHYKRKLEKIMEGNYK